MPIPLPIPPPAALLTSALMMLVRRIVERLGDVRTICMCLGVNIVGATILAFSYTFPMFIVGLVPWAFHMMLVPCLSSAASRQVRAEPLIKSSLDSTTPVLSWPILS